MKSIILLIFLASFSGAIYLAGLTYFEQQTQQPNKYPGVVGQQLTKEFLEKQSPQYNSQFETSTKNITDYEINNYSDLEEANEVSSFFNDYFSEQISKKQASSNTNHKINLDIFSSDDNKILVLQFSLYDFSNQNKLSEWGKSYFLQKK